MNGQPALRPAGGPARLRQGVPSRAPPLPL